MVWGKFRRFSSIYHTSQSTVITIVLMNIHDGTVLCRRSSGRDPGCHKRIDMILS